MTLAMSFGFSSLHLGRSGWRDGIAGWIPPLAIESTRRAPGWCR